MHVLVPRSVRSMSETESRRKPISGAALILDVEGSTALSARLAAYGSAGAEALGDVLRAVFAPMVDQVTAHGGEVATFAGDGIVAVFPGSLGEAIPRAARAATSIVADLTAAPSFDTPDGPADLAVRGAVGGGSIEWIVWTGDRPDTAQNATFTCTGTAISEALRGERLAAGGMVAVGPAARAHLPVETTATPLERGFVAVELGDATPAPPLHPDVPTPAAEPASPFFPPSLTSADVRSEFRDVVAVFIELNEVSTSDDRAMRLVLSLVDDHRGYLCDVVTPAPDSRGVRVLALWGAPRSHEHDIGYALRFAADVRAGLGDRNVRSGVTRGTTYAGFVGSATHASYTAVGATVNLAARLCSDAQWGDIRVDDAVAARLADPWVVTPVGSVSYRGFAVPVSTNRVDFVPPVRREDPLGDTFVGRSGDLDLLESLLAPLWSGRSPGIIAVTGEAGIGKSRLVAAVRERLDRRTPPPVWLEARADEIRTQPHATLRDALARYFGRPGEATTAERLEAYIDRLHAEAPDLADDLDRSRRALRELLDLVDGAAEPDPLDPQARFEQLVFAVESVVNAAAAVGPVILWVADAHWIDDGTQSIIERVASDLRSADVVVLIETRNPEAGLSADARVDLAGLEEREVAKLVAEHMEAPAPDDLVASLHERSEGNPFFLSQLLEFIDRGLDPSDIEPHGDSLPDDLRRVLVARLDDLPPATRRTVQTGAVLGRTVALPVLRAMLSNDADVRANSAIAVDAGIWDTVDADSVTFRHLMTREAAYGMLLGSDRRELHGLAADALLAERGSDDRNAAEIAHHLDRAERSIEAAEHYLIAGRMAADTYANADALAHAERARSLIGGTDSESELTALKIVHDVSDVLGDRERQERSLSEMSSIVEPGSQSAIEVALLRARFAASVGSYTDAEAILDDLPAGDATHDVTEASFLKAQLARYTGRIDQARRLAELAANRYAGSGQALRAATVDDFLGGIEWEQGAFEAAAERHRRAADIFRSLGRTTDEIRALNNLGTALISIGDYAAARSIHEAGAARSREIGYRMGEGDHLDNVGGTAWAVGDYDLAVERYEEALAIRRRMNDTWGIAISMGNLGGTYRAMGRTSEALDLYREALDLDRSIGRRRGEAYDLHGMGLCHLDLGHHDLATEALGHAARIRVELGEQHLANESHVACAVAMLRRGDVQEASELVDSTLDDEADRLFAGAVETTATMLRCIEVLEVTDPERASELRAITAAKVEERSKRISDPDQRASYLDAIESHRRALRA